MPSPRKELATMTFSLPAFPKPRLDYKPTSTLLFLDGNLLEELQGIRRHHASSVNQAMHIVTTALFFAFFSTTLVLLFRWFTLPDPVLVFLVIYFFPAPYLGFFWYLDPLIAIFWLPFFFAAIWGSIFIADGLTRAMPVYAAIPLSFAFACLALLVQLVGHLLLEEVPEPAFHKTLSIFKLTVTTPFFMGYCGLGWMSCWNVRKDTTGKIWNEEDEKPTLKLVGEDLPV